MARFSHLSDAQKKELVERLLQAYHEGQRLEDLARPYGVHADTLRRLILKVDPEGWYTTQEAKLYFEIEDGSAAASRHSRNSWDYRDKRLQDNIRRFRERHHVTDSTRLSSKSRD